MPDVTALFVTGLGTGLIAGGASCAAVQGGLLAGAVTRRTAGAPGRHRRRPGPRILTPVGLFLAGKLVSHTILGAALGTFGAAIQPSPGARAILLIGAAMLMALFALELLGVRALSSWLPRPPLAGFRLVRATARSRGLLAPLLLGVVTVLVPCGVTLSVELLAVTSGSAWAGSAVMAGFVIGTGPLFGVLGVVLRTSTKIWQGRLRGLTGLAIAVVAVLTLSSGLRLAGWTWSIGADPAPVAAAPAVKDVRPQRVVVRVTDEAYLPRRAAARAGRPTTLVLRTDGTSGCTRTIVIPRLGIERGLPRSGETSIALGSPAGTLRYTCGMGMYGGAIEFTASGDEP